MKLSLSFSLIFISFSCYAGKKPQLEEPFSLPCYNRYALLAEEQQENQVLPIVLIHGLTQNGNGMADTKKLLEELIPGVEVVTPDLPDRGFANCAFQIESLATFINNTPLLKDGFNVVAHSMGGVIARGVIESGLLKNRAYSLVTLATPHRGVYGVPYLSEHFKRHPYEQPYMHEEYYRIAYTDTMQHHSSIANSWNEPQQRELYLKKNIFLPRYNNETTHKDSSAFKHNLTTLLAFTALAAQHDSVLKPLESATWDYYDATHSMFKPLEESPIYDEIGLHELATTNRFKRYTVENADHSTIRTTKKTLQEYVVPSLARESDREDDAGTTLYEETELGTH